LCKNEIEKHRISFTDIANQDVQDKRKETIVSLPPGGNLHSYVPFYFWGQTPMQLVNEWRKKEMVFLAVRTQTIVDAKLSFVFTDRHAVVSYVTFYNNLEDLNKLDWKTIKLQYWASDEVDPARKEKKQAEFLVYEKLPWQFIFGIAVINEEVAANVKKLLSTQKHIPVVKVKPEWYYP
jgi:hypothetical protein